MNKELIKLANSHGQRSGQFISNSIADHLRALDRDFTDHDIGNLLFHISNDDLDRIVNTYANVLNARKGLTEVSNG